MGPAPTKATYVGEELKKNEWIKKGGYADLEKILPRILSQPAYESEAVEEYKHWNKTEFESIKSIDPDVTNKLKPIIRKGIPNEFKRDVIIKLFNVIGSEAKFTYENALKAVYGDTIPEEQEFAPTFTNYNKLEDALPIAFINKQGLEAAKRILWVLNQQYHIEYSPLVPIVLCLLLIFLCEHEAFVVMRTLIERSKKTNTSKEIRWHLTLRKIEFGKLINAYLEAYYKLSRNKGRKNLEHFRKIGYEPRILVESMFSTFFTEYVQFQLLMKILMIYLCEGTKTLFRMGYAIMKRLHETILTVKDPTKMIETLKKEGPGVITESGYITKWGFKMALTRNNNAYTQQKAQLTLPGLKLDSKTTLMYKHKMDFPSTLMKDSDMEYLFQYVPLDYQICSLQLVYATHKHGYSLTTLYTNSEKYENSKGMLFVMKTTFGNIFGGFCNKLFKITQVYYLGSEDSFVFMLSPKREVYKSAGVNTYYLCCDYSYFSFGGGGDGEAIRINEDFASGASYASETFANKPLTAERKDCQFKCAEFEVYALV